MSSKKELQECWKYVVKMTRNKNSFDIGFLHHICNILLDQELLSPEISQGDKPYYSSNLSTDFVNSVVDFLQQVLEKPQKKGQESSNQYLALIVLDSIIFNLYARSKNMDKLRLNNSFFNNSVSMSMSQMSDQWSQHNSVINNNQGELRLALNYIEALAINVNFFKKLKILYERTQNKNRNHHYLQNLLETLEYVLNKQKLTASKESFLSQRGANFKTFVYSQGQNFTPTPQILQQINTTIFTNQLNKVTNLLSTSSQQIFYALNRIYFVNKKSQERKHFRNIKFNANDMVFNLCKMYVESFKSKMEVFEESRNPLFLWMKNSIVCFFLPVFRKWTGIVCNLARQDHGSMIGFYKANEKDLQKNMILFIEELPLELVQFLNMLYRLIDKHFATLTPSQKMISPAVSQESIQLLSVSSLIPVKRFFIYSFLAEPQLIKEHIFSLQNQSKSPIEIEKFEETCNYMINLFFTSSAKKYSTSYTPQQLSVLMNLSHSIEQRLDEKLTQCDPTDLYYEINDDSQSQLSNYFIQEPILNYDYEILHKRISEIQFTPKDLKQFDIKKDFLYGGSKEILLQKDAEDDIVLNNQPTKPNMRYMRKQNEPTSFGQQRKYTHKRQRSESPSKIQDRQENYERPYYEARSNTYNIGTKDNFYSNQLQNEGDVDFLTWMTIGGNHNYKEKISAKKIKLMKTINLQGYSHQQNYYAPDKTNGFLHKKSINISILETDPLSQTKKSKLKQFRTFNRDKVKEINRLYEEYQCKNLYI